MTSRGFASLDVAAGLPDVLGCRWVADHADEVEPAGPDAGVIDLDGVNWFDDQALIAAAPGACWQAFLGVETEQPGLWLAYTPGTGLVEGHHADHEVMIPAEWAHPAGRTPAGESQLARITAVRDTLGALTSIGAGAVPPPPTPVVGGRTISPSPPPVARHTQPVLPGSPGAPMRRPAAGQPPAALPTPTGVRSTRGRGLS